jgi:hypothetical protein
MNPESLLHPETQQHLNDAEAKLAACLRGPVPDTGAAVAGVLSLFKACLVQQTYVRRGVSLAIGGPVRPPIPWAEFVALATASDDDARRLREAMRSIVLGPGAKPLLLVGPSRSGKSTICQAFRSLLGGSAVAMTPETVEHRFGLGRLLDYKLAIINGVNGYPDGCAQLKAVLSREVVSVSRAYQPEQAMRIDTNLVLCAMGVGPGGVAESIARRCEVVQLRSCGDRIAGVRVDVAEVRAWLGVQP